MLKNIGFLIVFFGAISESLWVYGLKYAHTTPQYIATIVATLISTYMLISSFKFPPTSLAYILYIGLGTVFVVASEILTTGKFDILEIFFIATLLIGVFGLKRIEI